MRGVSMRYFPFAVQVTAVLCITMTPLLAQTQDANIPNMMGEIAQLSAEQKQIAPEFTQSVALKKKIAGEVTDLAKQRKRLDVEFNEIKAQAPVVQRLCTGRYPRSQVAAATARCEAVKIPFNRRAVAYNKKSDRIAAAFKSLHQQEDARVAAAIQLWARYKQIGQRIAALEASIRALQVAAKPSSCSQACISKSGEALSQCMQSCFDGARSDTSLPTVEQKYLRPSGATTNRTPEQAIEEYKKSGAANPLPKSFRNDAAPPPSPSQ